MTGPCVLLTAVEASGDALGAGLMRALKTRIPHVRFVGVGGPQMAGEGLASLFDIGELSIMGFVEGLMAYGRARRRAGEVAALAAYAKPDAAVLIDSYGFSALTAKALRRVRPAMPLIKYVAPQVWGARSGRAKQLAGLFDHLVSILPLDRPYFEREQVGFTQAGHPMLARDFSDADGARLRTALAASPDEPVLLVLPGSRASEISRVMPAMEEGARLLRNENPALKVAVVAAPTVADAVRARVAALGFDAHMVEGEAAKRDAMKGATAALACSGTVTTELAMAGQPMVVAYKVSPMTAAIARVILKVEMATLFNLAAGRMVAPELIQEDCTPQKLAAAVRPLLYDQAARARQIAGQDAALELMGRGGVDPADTAAEVVMSYLARAQATA